MIKQVSSKIYELRVPLFTGLSIVGVALSGYLHYLHTLSSGPIPLCLTSGCDSVIGGDYSTILGVSIAFMGVVFYALLALLSIQRLYVETLMHEKLFTLVLLAGWGFTVYLRYLEFSKIGEICSWCWGSVVLMIVITFFYIIFYNRFNAISKSS